MIRRATGAGQPPVGAAGTPAPDRTTAAYHRLRDLILSHQLAPGMAIIETQAAARFGLTRITLRTALQRLEQEGYLASMTLGRYRRRVVVPLTVTDMEELFGLIGALEGMAAYRAAGLPAGPRRKLAAGMNRCNREMLKAVTGAEPDSVRARDADTQFHDLLLAGAGGVRLPSHLQAVRPQIARYRRIYSARLAVSMRIGYHEHSAVVRAIGAGAADEAARAIERHWRDAAARIRPEIEETGEHGMLVDDRPAGPGQPGRRARG